MPKQKKGYSLKEQVQIFYVMPLGWKTFITESVAMQQSNYYHQCRGSERMCVISVIHLAPSGTCINRFSSPGGESLYDASRR